MEQPSYKADQREASIESVGRHDMRATGMFRLPGHAVVPLHVRQLHIDPAYATDPAGSQPTFSLRDSVRESGIADAAKSIEAVRDLLCGPSPCRAKRATDPISNEHIGSNGLPSARLPQVSDSWLGIDAIGQNFR